MGYRYYIMKEYNIEIILFNFYEIVWETCWYYEIIWEIPNIYRGISCCIQRYEKYTIYSRKLELYRMRTYSSHYSSYHFAPLSLLLSLRLIIAIIITSLDHRYRYYYHSARSLLSLSLSLLLSLLFHIIAIIVTIIAISWY